MGILFLFTVEIAHCCQIEHNCYRYNPFQDKHDLSMLLFQRSRRYAWSLSVLVKSSMFLQQSLVSVFFLFNVMITILYQEMIK